MAAATAAAVQQAAGAVSAAQAVLATIADRMEAIQAEDEDLKAVWATVQRGRSVAANALQKEIPEEQCLPLVMCLDKAQQFVQEASKAHDEHQKRTISLKSAGWALGQYHKSCLAMQAELEKQISFVAADPRIGVQATDEEFPPSALLYDKGILGNDQGLLKIEVKDLFERNGLKYEHEDTRPSKKQTVDFFSRKFGSNEFEWDDKLECICSLGLRNADVQRAVTVLDILARGDHRVSHYERAQLNTKKIAEELPGLTAAITNEVKMDSHVVVAGSDVTLDWFHRVQQNTANILTSIYNVAPSLAHAIPLLDLSAVLDSVYAAGGVNEARFRISEFITRIVKQSKGATAISLYEIKFVDTIDEKRDVVNLGLMMSTITVVVTRKASPSLFGDDKEETETQAPSADSRGGQPKDHSGTDWQATD